METDFGLLVVYNLAYDVRIELPTEYRNKTCGLCGNFDEDRNNEFILPDGVVVIKENPN